jgi:hypothetical protein
MGHSSLLQLPVEVRLTIYKAVLQLNLFHIESIAASSNEPRRIAYRAYFCHPLCACNCYPECKLPIHRASPRDFLALASTCRLVHAELITLRDASATFGAEVQTISSISSRFDLTPPVPGTLTIRHLRHLSIVIPVGRSGRIASNTGVENMCSFISSNMPQLQDLLLHVTLKESWAKQYFPVTSGMVKVITKMHRLKNFRIRVGPRLKGRAQRGSCGLNKRLLPLCPRAPLFRLWPLYMIDRQNFADSGARIRYTQTDDREQIDWELRFVFEQCVDGILCVFRNPTSKFLCLWHEINIRSASLPEEVHPVFVA